MGPQSCEQRRALHLSAAAVASWVVFLGGAGVANAEEPAAPPGFTLSEAVDLAVRENPGLRSVRTRWEAMRERPAQAAALPNPMFTYGGMDMANGGAWPDTNGKRFMVQQEFPWLGKRTLREAVAGGSASAGMRVARV